jgi:hypothetical protein
MITATTFHPPSFSFVYAPHGTLYHCPIHHSVQDRAVQLVAGHLLDASATTAGGAPELAANLERNLSDAIGLLPKMATAGADVNVRFNDIKGFEVRPRSFPLPFFSSTV